MKLVLYFLLVEVLETCAKRSIRLSEPGEEITYDSGALDFDISDTITTLMQIKPTPIGKTTSVGTDKESLSSSSVITTTPSGKVSNSVTTTMPSGKKAEVVIIPNIVIYISLGFMSVLLISIVVTAVCCLVTDCS